MPQRNPIWYSGPRGNLHSWQALVRIPNFWRGWIIQKKLAESDSFWQSFWWILGGDITDDILKFNQEQKAGKKTVSLAHGKW